jgi:GxxExxY protein
LGPGLLESIYERALLFELNEVSLPVKSQVEISVLYRGRDLGLGLRLDLLVDGQLVVEIKSVSRLDEVHLKQMLTYLRMARVKTGLLINFNAAKLADGIKRVSV